MTYANFIAQLYFVYEAMEDELAKNQAHDIVGPIYFPQELNRLASLEQDLEFLYGSDWKNQIQMLSVTKDYVGHIRSVGKERPQLLMAHVFTRYMGDLFGGQILKRKWRKLFAFPEDKGIMFYTFRAVDSIPKLREFIEMRVNSLEMSLKEKYVQLEEMKAVFKFNTDLVLEILEVAKRPPGGFLPPPEKGEKVMTWAEEIKELGIEGQGGCVFATKGMSNKGQCPVDHNSKNSSSCPMSQLSNSALPKYGLLLCATLAVAYPIARKVWH
jgi:heme oxygenase